MGGCSLDVLSQLMSHSKIFIYQSVVARFSRNEDKGWKQHSSDSKYLCKNSKYRRYKENLSQKMANGLQQESAKIAGGCMEINGGNT